MLPYRFERDERLPVEVLVFRVDPEHTAEFLEVDHEVWTLGEAFAGSLDRIPFLSKEVWLDDSRPGEVTLVFVWESMEAWRTVDNEHLQRRLQARFDRAFPHRVRLVRAVHEVVAYRTVPAQGSLTQAAHLLRDGTIDIITFTSSSTVTNLAAVLKRERVAFTGAAVACIGPKTADTARRESGADPPH